MKNIKSLVGCLIISLLTVPIFAQDSERQMPILPLGSMTATPTVVQVGVTPTLNWVIYLPQNINKSITIRPPNTIEQLDDFYVSVRTVGIDKDYTDVRMSVDRGSYFQLFYGSKEDVEPQNPLYIKKLNKHSQINFGGRYIKDGVWTSLFTTNSVNGRALILSNGDDLPEVIKGEMEKNNSYLSPYVNGSNKVRISPLSLLVLLELDDNGSFDHDDITLLVTFSKPNPNNGHGNNIDGVDSSNPGAGGGGPNGEVDPSGGVDDEKK